MLVRMRAHEVRPRYGNRLAKPVLEGDPVGVASASEREGLFATGAAAGWAGTSAGTGWRELERTNPPKLFCALLSGTAYAGFAAASSSRRRMLKRQRKSCAAASRKTVFADFIAPILFTI